MRTSLTRWLNHSINRQSKNPHSQHPPDGDLTGLMTANRWTPNVFLNTIKKNIDTIQVSGLRTHHFVQIQFIQTSPNQHLYEEKMQVLKGTSKHLMIPFVQRIFHSFLLNNNHFYRDSFFVDLQPQSQKFQQAAYAQNLLKDLPPNRVRS